MTKEVDELKNSLDFSKIRIGSHRWSVQSDRDLEYIEWDSLPEDVDEQRDNLGRYFYDRDYENILLIFFKSGAGGLFLSNCLALSDNVGSIFIDIEEKIRFFNMYLESQKVFWNDCYINNTSPEVHQNNKEYFRKKYHFVYEHNPRYIKQHLKFWSNCNVIYFTNPDLFCKIRQLLKNIDGNLGYISYEKVKEDLIDYPVPKSFKDFFNLPKETQESLKNAYKSEENINSFSFLKNKKLFYVWDTNWYFSEEDTVSHIKELYDLFGFDDFNVDVVTEFYRKWISKLDEFSLKEIPNNIQNLLKDEKNFDKSITSFWDLY
jgi:hypothetical protein